jgi:hypothetical protein
MSPNLMLYWTLQVLRAGAVPVYWGATNVREYLPDPLAAVFVEDFVEASGSLDFKALAAYIKHASEHEAVYNQHLRWKLKPLPSAFLHNVVEKPVDSVLCQVCDEVAKRWGDTIGPVAGGEGQSVIMPPCITATFREGQDRAVVRNWGLPSGQANTTTKPSPLFRAYVLSIASQPTRQSFIRQQLANIGLQADLVAAFDGPEITESWRDCVTPRSLLDNRHLLDRNMSRGELSLATKHLLAAWDIFQSGSSGLVLEDDALLPANLTVVLNEAISQAPMGWDLIVPGTCFGITATKPFPAQVVKPFSSLLSKCEKVCSRCSHALLWSADGARKLLASMPLRTCTTGQSFIFKSTWLQSQRTMAGLFFGWTLHLLSKTKTHSRVHLTVKEQDETRHHHQTWLSQEW